MKPLATHWPVWCPCEAHSWQIRIPATVITFRDMLAALSAIAAVVVAVLLAAWVATIGSGHVLAGGTWGAAIVFAALAVDEWGPKSVLLGLTAAALILLAWLQASVAAGFVILGAGLVAPWIAAWVFRRLP